MSPLVLQAAVRCSLGHKENTVNRSRLLRRQVGPHVVLLAVLALWGLACGASATPTSTPPGVVVEGEQLFVSKGCAACHGDSAQGTSIAPGLSGHTEGEVKRQVRAPLGIMPVFPPDRISNAELGAIAAYIGSLPAGHGHQGRADEGQEVVIHHWMALFAIEDGNTPEAAHHIEHIMELVTGDHLARMEEALADVEAGELHDAAHTIEAMLAGLEEKDLTETTTHLRLALSAARVESAPDAIHHVEHFMELAAEADIEAGEEVLALLEGGEFLEAGHHLEELLGAAGEAEDPMDEHEEDEHEESEVPVE